MEKSIGEVVIVDSHQGGKVEKLRSRMRLCSEILQSMRHTDDVTKILETVVIKLLKLLNVVHVSVYKLSPITHTVGRMSGQIVAEAIAPNCDICSQIQIENILNDEYAWIQSTTGEIFDLYAAGTTRCEINLTEIFAGKAYLLVPIALTESDQDHSLWGFLTVHHCSAVNSEPFQVAWDRDDVVMLQEIAIQIEISLHRENQNNDLRGKLAESNQAYTILHQWMQQYRTLVEEIPNVSYVSPIANTPEFAYISPQLKELLGVSSEEWNAGFFNSWANYVHPDDRDRVHQEVGKTIETGEPFCSEYRFVSRNGKIIWVRDNARIGLAIDGKTKVLRGSAFDISDRKETELKFKAIFNNTFQFVGLLSLDGILLEANQTALDFGGITRDEVIGKPFWETHWFSYSEDIQNVLQQSTREAAQGEFIRYEVDVMGAGGTTVTIDFSIRPLKDESGEVILLIPEGRDISDLKAIEQNLRKSEARLIEAQRITKLGNWEWDVASDTTIWSHELFRIFDRDPALGAPAYEDVLQLYIEEDREKHRQAVQLSVSTGESYYLELRILRPDGSYGYLEASGHAECDKHGKVIRLYGTAQDISDRKKIEQELLQNKALLRLTLENAPIGIARLAPDGKFLSVNHAFCEIYGYAAEELLNMTAFDITHPDSIARTLATLQGLTDNKTNKSQIEKQYIHKNGNIIDAISRVSLMRDVTSNSIQFITIVEDITDRKKIEAKLELAKLSEAAIQAKTEFLAIMSHELRTPMNAVIGMTEILRRTPLSSEQQQYLAIIRQGGAILLSVINNVLDFSQIESGDFKISRDPFEVQQCVEDVLDLMTSRIAEKSLELSALISPDVPQQVIGDYVRLRQILINLVSNAIKFTQIGEIVITVSWKNGAEGQGRLLFAIRDTGVGIATEELDKLFKAFSQANRSIARQYGGTGLGLVICKQLCELMGGGISVNSTIGEGSTFSFSIMASAIANSTEEPEQDEESMAEHIVENLSELCEKEVNLGGKRILLVCNNPNIGQAIAMYTQAWQISTQIAQSGSDAMLLFESANFDAVLIDENLAEMDALELASDIHQIFPDLKLVLLTFVKVNLNESDFEKSLEKAFESTKMNSAKFAAYINKPITSSKLYQTLINIFYPKQAKSIPDSPNPANNSASNPSTPEQVTTKEIPLSILIVEDNLINQQLLLKMLKRLGYQVEVVSNGQKAVEAVTQKNYEIIFMDLQMPIMDGLTATTHIRQLPNRQPWIIGLSANSFAESHQSALAVGMDEYLTKPLAPEDLSTALIRVSQTFAKDVLQISPQLNIKIPPQTSTKKNPQKLDSSSINLGIFKSIENSVGKENLSEVVNNYFNQAEREIAIMRDAFTNQDIVTLEANNHSLKGGSGLFGATRLLKLCRSLQFMCKICIESNEQAIDDIEQIGIVLKNIEEEYHLVKQALKALQ